MLAISISDPSGTADARRRATGLAKSLDFTEIDTGKLAIVVTEIATNLVKHASGGEIFLRSLVADRGHAIEVMGIDHGPGIADVNASMRDGHTTAGTAGTGLGAISRLAALVEIHSVRDGGTVVRAVCTTAPAGLPKTAAFDTGLVSTPKRGEEVCGDAASWLEAPGGLRAVVADGLGHGVLAAEASRAAVDAFHRSAASEVNISMERLHASLRPTRGVAVALADIRTADEIVRFCGIGNIAAVINSPGGNTHLVSMNGIVGHQARSIRVFDYPWKPDSVLVMHSDGLSSRWDLSSYGGLRRRSASIIAAILHRDARRNSDDATVLVMKAT